MRMSENGLRFDSTFTLLGGTYAQLEAQCVDVFQYMPQSGDLPVDAFVRLSFRPRTTEGFVPARRIMMGVVFLEDLLGEVWPGAQEVMFEPHPTDPLLLPADTMIPMLGRFLSDFRAFMAGVRKHFDLRMDVRLSKKERTAENKRRIRAVLRQGVGDIVAKDGLTVSIFLKGNDRSPFVFISMSEIFATEREEQFKTLTSGEGQPGGNAPCGWGEGKGCLCERKPEQRA